MRRLTLPLLLVVLGAWMLGLLVAPDSARAQMYRWTDEQGETHYSDGLDSIPARFRSRAVKMGDVTQPPGTGPTAPGASAGPGAPPGGARIEFTPGKPIVVAARINGRGTVRLMLDTGADGTVINPSTLYSLGVSHRDAVRGRARGVGGRADVLYVRVDTIEVGSARVGPLIVASHSLDFGSGYDGLLGRDFLNAFTLEIDNARGVATLTPKTPQPTERAGQ